METTVYSTPPSEAEELPSSIRANLMLPPQSLLASLHTRSLKLFTPWVGGSDGDAGSQRSLSARYLPPQVVVTLVLVSMKLNAPEVGEGIVEDWPMRRGDPEGVLDGGDGYEKVIELYFLRFPPLWRLGVLIHITPGCFRVLLLPRSRCSRSRQQQRSGRRCHLSGVLRLGPVSSQTIKFPTSSILTLCSVQRSWPRRKREPPASSVH